MPDHDRGNAPGQRAVGVAVQVYEIGAVAVFEREQPISRAIHVVPRFVHPLESETTLVQQNTGDPADLDSLRGIERVSHRRQHDLDGARSEKARELDGVAPHTPVVSLVTSTRRGSSASPAGRISCAKWLSDSDF